jgi:hypothetical protein
VGWVLSSENKQSGRRRFLTGGRQHEQVRYRESLLGPA